MLDELQFQVTPKVSSKPCARHRAAPENHLISQPTLGTKSLTPGLAKPRVTAIDNLLPSM